MRGSNDDGTDAGYVLDSIRLAGGFPGAVREICWRADTNTDGSDCACDCGTGCAREIACVAGVCSDSAGGRVGKPCAVCACLRARAWCVVSLWTLYRANTCSLRCGG